MVKEERGVTSKLKQIRSACNLYSSKIKIIQNICQYNNIVQMPICDNKFNPTNLVIYSSIKEN